MRIDACHLFDELPSTNDFAKTSWGARTLTGPALILARLQTAGRGRGNNVWISGPNDLTFSIVMPRTTYPIMEGDMGPLSLWTAIGVGKGLDEEHGDIRWKWPNDLYAYDRKLGGILIETVPRPTPAVVVGVGVNLGNNRPVTNAIGLSEVVPRADDRFNVLLSVISFLDRVWVDASQGDLAANWAERCMLTGRPVTVMAAEEKYVGTFAGVESTGAMLLQMDSETKSFFSASVAIQ